MVSGRMLRRATSEVWLSISFSSALAWLISLYRMICRLSQVPFLLYRDTSNQEFQWPTPAYSAIQASIGVDSGRTILPKMVISPAPSMRADSNSASGRPWM